MLGLEDVQAGDVRDSLQPLADGVAGYAQFSRRLGEILVVPEEDDQGPGELGPVGLSPRRPGGAGRYPPRQSAAHSPVRAASGSP